MIGWGIDPQMERIGDNIGLLPNKMQSPLLSAINWQDDDIEDIYRCLACLT